MLIKRALGQWRRFYLSYQLSCFCLNTLHFIVFSVRYQPKLHHVLYVSHYIAVNIYIVAFTGDGRLSPVPSNYADTKTWEYLNHCFNKYNDEWIKSLSMVNLCHQWHQSTELAIAVQKLGLWWRVSATSQVSIFCGIRSFAVSRVATWMRKLFREVLFKGAEQKHEKRNVNKAETIA